MWFLSAGCFGSVPDCFAFYTFVWSVDSFVVDVYVTVLASFTVVEDVCFHWVLSPVFSMLRVSGFSVSYIPCHEFMISPYWSSPFSFMLSKDQTVVWSQSPSQVVLVMMVSGGSFWSSVMSWVAVRDLRFVMVFLLYHMGVTCLGFGFVG